jgi:hypothetical protein
MSTFNPIFYYNMISQNPSFLSSVIAAYKFEGNGNDSHTGGFNATNGGSVTFSSTNASDGLAGQFISNTNSRLTIADNNAFSFTNGTVDSPFSIKANVRSISSGLTQPIFSKYTGANNNTSEYLFYLRAPTGRLAILLFNRNVGGGFIGVETTASVTNGLVNNVIVTYNGSGTVGGIQMYINGILQSVNNLSSGTYVGMGNTTVTPIIGNRSGGNNPFVGTIDELYIFNAVLTTTQIATLQSNYYPNF